MNVTVLLRGRPIYVNPEIIDSFRTASLPNSMRRYRLDYEVRQLPPAVSFIEYVEGSVCQEVSSASPWIRPGEKGAC